MIYPFTLLHRIIPLREIKKILMWRKVVMLFKLNLSINNGYLMYQILHLVVRITILILTTRNKKN